MEKVQKLNDMVLELQAVSKNKSLGRNGGEKDERKKLEKFGNLKKEFEVLERNSRRKDELISNWKQVLQGLELKISNLEKKNIESLEAEKRGLATKLDTVSIKPT